MPPIKVNQYVILTNFSKCFLVAFSLYKKGVLAVNLNYMQYFVRAVDLGTISEAAAELFITPQGLSQALHRMDKEYGVRLIYHESNRVLPTQAGKNAYDIFSKILSLNEDAVQKIREQPSDNAGGRVLNIFASPFFTESVLRHIVQSYSRRDPDVSLRIMELPCREVYSLPARKQDTICLYGASPSGVAEFANRFSELDERHPLLRTDVLACVSANSPLAGKASVSASDLKNAEIVLCRNEELFLRAACPGFGASNVNVRTHSKGLCFSYISSRKNAVGFTNRAELYGAGNKKLAAVPLEAKLEMVYGYLVSRDGARNPAVVSLIEMLEAHFKKVEQSS